MGGLDDRHTPADLWDVGVVVVVLIVLIILIVVVIVIIVIVVVVVVVVTHLHSPRPPLSPSYATAYANVGAGAPTTPGAHGGGVGADGVELALGTEATFLGGVCLGLAYGLCVALHQVGFSPNSTSEWKRT